MSEIEKQMGIVQQVYAQGWQDGIALVERDTTKHLERLKQMMPDDEYSQGFAFGIKTAHDIIKIFTQTYGKCSGIKEKVSGR